MRFEVGRVAPKTGQPANISLMSGTALVVYLALAKFLVHMLVANNYGYFRDELYYMAAGRHLAFGYVDFPPFIAVLAAAVHLALGDSLVALHIFPAIAGAFLVLLTGLMAREFGGSRFAQALAALASLVVLTFLGVDAIFSMDAFDELWWAIAAYVLIRLLKRDQPRLWLVFGLVAGIGLTTKVTILFFGFAIVVGLLLTPGRRHFRCKWLWLGGLIALAFFLPYVLWNAANGFPTVQFWSHYGGKLEPISPPIFLVQQILTMNPVTLPLWLAGLYFFFFTAPGKPYRALGYAYVALYVLFTVTGAKFYFLAPAYPMLFAGGAVVVDQAILKRGWTWLRTVYPLVLVAGGVLVAPVALPLLPPATFDQIYGFLGGDAGIQNERHATAQLPQWLADRFGWLSMVATVAGVYDKLPPDERSSACIFTANYGEAAAIDFFGPAYHLPPAISGHNNYFLWGPRGCTGIVVITVGASKSDLEPAFGDVTQAATITCQNCMPYENDDPVYVARQPKRPIQEIWPTVKHFD
jgi:hypothetical protein